MSDDDYLSWVDIRKFIKRTILRKEMLFYIAIIPLIIGFIIGYAVRSTHCYTYNMESAIKRAEWMMDAYDLYYMTVDDSDDFFNRLISIPNNIVNKRNATVLDWIEAYEDYKPVSPFAMGVMLNSICNSK